MARLIAVLTVWRVEQQHVSGRRQLQMHRTGDGGDQVPGMSIRGRHVIGSACAVIADRQARTIAGDDRTLRIIRQWHSKIQPSGHCVPLAGIDVWQGIPALVRSKLRTGGDQGTLVRNSHATGIPDLVRIKFTGVTAPNPTVSSATPRAARTQSIWPSRPLNYPNVSWRPEGPHRGDPGVVVERHQGDGRDSGATVPRVESEVP